MDPNTRSRSSGAAVVGLHRGLPPPHPPRAAAAQRDLAKRLVIGRLQRGRLGADQIVDRSFEGRDAGGFVQHEVRLQHACKGSKLTPFPEHLSTPFPRITLFEIATTGGGRGGR